MRRRVVTLGGMAVGSTVLAMAEPAAGDPAVDVPYASSVYSTTEPYNRYRVECTQLGAPAANGQPRVECTFFQTLITMPRTQAVVDAELAEAEKRLREDVKADAPRFWASCFKDVSTTRDQVPEELRPGYDAYKAACEKKDLPELVKAFGMLNARATKTCRLTSSVRKETLTRIDANTWSSSTGPNGTCNVTLVQTLSRDKVFGRLWNYKQVRTIPENERGPMCAAYDRLIAADWRWDGNKGKKLGCEYIE